MKDDPLKAATSSALLRLLEPLAQLAMQVGVGVGDVQALVERAFVSGAVTSALEAGESHPENVAQLAVRTGLHRSTVRLLLEMKDPQAVRPRPFQNFAVRVLWAWCTEPEYVDSGGIPKILPLRGQAPSFQALIKLSVGDELSRTILKELQRVGAVRRVRDNRVQVVRRTYGNVAWKAAEIATAGEELREHARVVIQCLQHRDFQPFRRYVVSASLPEEKAAILERDFSSASHALFNGLESALKLEEAISSRGLPDRKSRLCAQMTVIREPVVEPHSRARRAGTRRRARTKIR